MQTRYMERSSSMAAREKRRLDPSTSQEAQPDRKRPALASVIVEALKLDSLQKLCSSLEPILRRVVSEEVERALAKLGPAKLNRRVSPKRIEGPDGRNLQLHFRSKLSLPLFTGGKIEGEQGAAIHIVLVDANTGHVVTSGPESAVKLDVVVLEGDFNNEDDESWTLEEFGSHIVKEREGKRPLLTGDLQVTLKDGVGTLGELTFTDNSSWIRSRRFRLGLKVASGRCDGFYIREAKTDAFTVKDHRGELYKKHYPPALNDEVWRLEKIGKDGSFHKKLLEAGIATVKVFLLHVMRDPQRLRNILGGGMSNKMWDVLVEHAKTGLLSGKFYIYRPDEPENVEVVFNDIFALIGLIADGLYDSIDSLSHSQMVFVDTLVQKAYENWINVREHDGEYLLNFALNKNSAVSQNDNGNSLQEQPNSFNHLGQLGLQSLPASVPALYPYTNPGLTLGGHNNEIGSRYTMQSQNTDLNVALQLDGNSFALHTTQQAQPSGTQNTLTLCPPQLNMPSLQSVGIPNLTIMGYEDLTEDDIRIQSHVMPENEDMLRMLSTGGHGSSSYNITENNFPFTPFTPSYFDFQEDRRSSSGKAVVGWLKLKAALRWGIFIRKKAAERRAQIVELDDF